MRHHSSLLGGIVDTWAILLQPISLAFPKTTQVPNLNILITAVHMAQSDIHERKEKNHPLFDVK
jgi:hypothetical protein